MFFVSLVGGNVRGQALPRPTITDLAPGVVANPCNANLLVYGDFENLPFECEIDDGGGSDGNLISLNDTLNQNFEPLTHEPFMCGLGACCMGWVSHNTSILTPDFIPGHVGHTPCYPGQNLVPRMGAGAIGIVTHMTTVEAFRVPLGSNVQLVQGNTYRLTFYVNELCGNVPITVNVFATETPTVGSDQITPALPNQIQNLPATFTCMPSGNTIRAFPIGSAVVLPSGVTGQFQQVAMSFTVPQNYTGNAREIVVYISQDGLNPGIGINRFSAVFDDFDLRLDQPPLTVSNLSIDYECRNNFHGSVDVSGGVYPIQYQWILTNSNNSCTLTTNQPYANIVCFPATGANILTVVITDACGNTFTDTISYNKFVTENCCNSPDVLITPTQPPVQTTYVNKKVRIIGNVDVHQNLIFDNCIIYMGQNADLNMYGNLTLNNTTVTICPNQNYMWEAIRIKGSNNVLTITNANLMDDYIEYGIYGVVIEQNNSLIARRAVFRNNLFSLLNYADNGLDIQGSAFRAGNLLQNSQNITYSRVAIVNYGKNVVIGSSSNPNPLLNVNIFSNYNSPESEAVLQKGAINFTVFNNSFGNCTYAIRAINASGLCLRNNVVASNSQSLSVGILSENSSITTERNNFDNLHFGIIATGIGKHLFSQDRHQRIRIAGVYALSEKMEIEVTNCTMASNSARNCVGVAIFEMDIASAIYHAHLIHDTRFFNVGTGVFLFQAQNPEIYNNNISISGIQPVLPNSSRACIALISSSFPYVYMNTINSANSTATTHGIFADETDNLIAINNTFQRFLTNGITLSGLSVAGPKYVCNSFDRIGTAMYFVNNSNSLVGNNFFHNQLPTMNRFRGVSNHSIADNTQLSSNGVPLAFYYYRNNVQGLWTEEPSINNFVNYPTISSLIPQLTTVSTNITCASHQFNKTKNYPVALQPILTNKDWENHLRLMAEIVSDTTLLQDSVYAQFYQSHLNDNIYQFALAQKYALTDTAISNQILRNVVTSTAIEEKYKNLKLLVRKKAWDAQDSLWIEQIAHQPFEEGTHKYLAAALELLQNKNPQAYAELWVPAFTSGQSRKANTVTFVEEEQLSDVFIYPNPTHGEINIEGIEWQTAVVYDMLGKEVFKTQQAGNIHIEHLEAGVYVLKLFGTKGELLVVQKIVKE